MVDAEAHTSQSSENTTLIAVTAFYLNSGDLAGGEENGEMLTCRHDIAATHSKCGYLHKIRSGKIPAQGGGVGQGGGRILTAGELLAVDG